MNAWVDGVDTSEEQESRLLVETNMIAAAITFNMTSIIIVGVQRKIAT